MDRDEARDIVDVVTMCRGYSFRWPDILEATRAKQVFDDEALIYRLNAFPLEWIRDVPLFEQPIDFARWERDIHWIAGDIAAGRENGLSGTTTELATTKQKRGDIAD